MDVGRGTVVRAQRASDAPLPCVEVADVRQLVDNDWPCRSQIAWHMEAQ
jgi:hypothetical protein